MQAALVAAEQAGHDTTGIDASIEQVESDMAASGCAGRCSRSDRPRRARSTKRRQDAPDLPRRKVEARTIGRTFTAPTARSSGRRCSSP